ncbi:MAG: S-layer homology domain-containing protein [Lawsonibacter sp.]|nr:S-layer homology domain-containing protein [Lawsonibacter sp.]
MESGRHGTIRVTPTSAQKGETVTLTVKPDAGWTLTGLTVTAGKKEVPLTEKEKGTYTFTMPAAGVKVQGTFALEEGGGAPLPFIDVPQDSWFYEAVRYAYEKGIMSGSGEDIFTPDQTTSRGMIVTILYSLEGKPAAGTARFDDVSSSDWFAKAVAWAAANGVVSGYGDGRFGPNDPITREQLALILRGYARLQGKDVAAEADLSAFADRGEISTYALEAVEWAVARGLISGTSPDTLSPAGRATRAQAAVILKGFCENVIAG